MKAVGGVASDVRPIFGSRRAASLLLGALGFLTRYAVLATVVRTKPAYLAARLLVTIGYMIRDVVADELSVEIARNDVVVLVSLGYAAFGAVLEMLGISAAQEIVRSRADCQDRPSRRRSYHVRNHGVAHGPGAVGQPAVHAVSERSVRGVAARLFQSRPTDGDRWRDRARAAARLEAALAPRASHRSREISPQRLPLPRRNVIATRPGPGQLGPGPRFLSLALVGI